MTRASWLSLIGWGIYIQYNIIILKKKSFLNNKFYTWIIYRLEHDSLREENQQIRDKLRLARQESIDAELNAEKVRQSAIEASVQAREAIATEKKRHLDLEEDIRLKNKELRALKEELSTQQNVWTLKFQKQESELSRLRSRLSAAAIPNSEVESRLSNLTRTLVIKQQELENLTTDRNALRLQLEKLEVNIN